MAAYLLFSSPHPASAEENITSYNAAFTLNSDSTVNVQEEIIYDFGDSQRHGIFRTIPYRYQARGGYYTVNISDIKVTDNNSRSYPTTTKREGNNLNIKIGDPDQLVTGQITYIISYQVAGAINYFSGQDEFYWNVTGTDWTIPISNIIATVELPLSTFSTLRSSLLSMPIACYAGPSGSNTPCANYLVSTLPNQFFFYHPGLAAHEGLTIVVGLPKGALIEPNLQEKWLKTAQDNWVVILPFLTLIVLFYQWYTRGRDPQGRGTIIPQYEPPAGLTPSQVGTIIDEHAQNTDITADIIQLAVNGYLHIHQTEERKLFGKNVDYVLTKLKEEDSLINDIDRQLLQKIFTAGEHEIKLSTLKNKFYKHLPEIKDRLYQSTIVGGYFIKRPDAVRLYYLIAAIVIGTGGGISGALSNNAIMAASLITSGLIIAAFSFFMPVKTRKGVAMKEYILGLKRYLSVAEKDRLAFHNAPAKNPARFDLLLPYAMVLGVEKQWAQQFSDVYREPPRWYSGASNASSFNTILFASHMRGFSTATNSVLASHPSSAAHGGSGFSGGGVGGGFGGGGGGSW